MYDHRTPVFSSDFPLCPMMARSVLFLTRSLSPAPGGMRTHASELIGALSDMPGMCLRVIAHRGGTWMLPIFVCRALAAILFSRYSTVHAGDASLTFLFPFVACFRPGVRRTCTVHGLDLLWNAPGYRRMLRWTLRMAHEIVAVSHATAREAVALGVPESRITVIPCGIRMPSSPTQPTKPTQPPSHTLLSLGRLVPRKGVAWFLEHVFPKLAHDDASLRYVIAGDGSDSPRMRSLVASLGLEERVTLLGCVPEQRKKTLLQGSSLLVQPNIRLPNDMEGFGIICIEAAAHGLPTVAARLEGLEDAVIDGVTGSFFLPEDPLSAADAVRCALSAEWDRPRMMRVCHEHFSADCIASRYVYEIF